MIYKFTYNNTILRNGNFSGHSVYIVPKNFPIDGKLSQFLVHKINDSISALGTPAYWFILGQHGYYIPKVKLSGRADYSIGDQVKDENNRIFQVIDIAGNEVYLAPSVEIKKNQINRSWTQGAEKFSTLSLINGSLKSRVESVQGYQIKPMMVKEIQKVLIDDREIKGYGKYRGNTVTLYDIFSCIDPATATFDGIRSMSGQELITVKQSFFFKEKSIYSSTNLAIKKNLPFIKYHGIQPVGLLYKNDYQTFAIYPKVKPKNKKGKKEAVNWNFPTDITEENITKYSQYFFKVNSEDLEDVTDIPDRVIQFQKDKKSNTFGIGFSSGLDLVNGLTSKNNRPKYTSESFALSTDLSNKTYFRVLTASKFKDGVLPKGFNGQFNSYFSYFKPEKDLQYYTVHTKNFSYLYIHLQKKISNQEIPIEDFLSGKKYKIVERKGVEILDNSSTLSNNIHIKSINDASNYIVLQVLLNK